jgi:hypothetical protein
MGIGVRASGCPATHGQYTNVLCNGDDLAADGAYLVTGSVRMYMQAHSIETYDLNANPQHIRTFYNGANGDPFRIRGLGNHWEVWDIHDNVLSFGFFPDDIDSNGYMKLLSDGCLWSFDSDDTNIGGFCGS